MSNEPIPTIQQAALDLLYVLPYWRGKGKITLALLQRMAINSPVAAKMSFGCRMWIGPDPMRQTVLPYWIGQYEAHVISIFKERLANVPSDAGVIDVGANLGFYTVLAAGYLRNRSRGKVYAFEPNRQANAELANNVSLNRFTNVELSSNAISNEAGTADFYSDPEGITLGSLKPSQRSTAAPVEMTTLDTLRAQSGPIGLLKIDIEGAELPALQGAQRLLQQDRPAVIFEEFDTAYGEFGYTMREVRNYFHALAYKLYWVRAGLRGATLQELSKETEGAQAHYRNILAMPGEAK